MKDSTRKNLGFIAATFLILLASFAFNLFGASTPETFRDFQLDSESIVKSTVICEVVNGRPVFKGLLVFVPDSTYWGSCNPEKIKPYASQFGLQAKAISIFAPNNLSDLSRYFNLITVVFAALTAAIFALFLWAVRREWGTATALVTTFLLAMSPFLVNFARNLFWSTFLLFAPFVLGFAFYPWFKEKKHLLWFYLAFGLLIALKSATGYEYLSSVVLSGFVPVLYFELKEKSPIAKLVKKFFVIVAFSAGGFGVALAAHVAVLASYLGSFSAVFQSVVDRAAIRMIGLAGNLDWPSYVLELFKGTYPRVFDQIEYWLGFLGKTGESLHSGVSMGMISLLHYLLSPALTMPIYLKYPFDILVGSVLFMILLVGIILWRLSLLSGFRQPRVRALIAAVGFAFLASFSWAVVGYSHMLAHPHINTIIFFIPFFPMAYVAIGLWLTGGLSRKVS
uniref:Glycosyltransferase RgtA/B/C/D-like domain-containing protein n=1 Tax=candidate division WWE3 bacterium TaxID=2053526 RepID=A0A831Z1H4_UNCKA